MENVDPNQRETQRDASSLYAFARVSALVGLKVEHRRVHGRRTWLEFREKGGKVFEVPLHHEAEDALDAYLAEAGIAAESASPLFRAARGRTGELTENGLSRENAYALLRRCARRAGLEAKIGCHSCRATGITAFLENGGSLEDAQAMARHATPKTTKLYDRRRDAVTLDQVERVVFR